MIPQSEVDDDSNNDSDIEEESTLEVIDEIPNLLLSEHLIFDWNGQNATIFGFVVDESVMTSYVSLIIFDEAGMNQVGLPFNASVMADG